MEIGSPKDTDVIASPQIRDLLGPPPLVEGEEAGAYEALAERIRFAVEPGDVLEEFWVRDVLDLVWETLRLRRLKAKLFQAGGRKGLVEILRPHVSVFDLGGLADSWARREPKALKKVDAVLEQAGLDADAIVAKTLEVSLDTFEKIDRMIMQTEVRRNGILREIDRHRDVLAQRLREKVQAIEDAEFTEVATEGSARE
jgi:hypothetical protein